MNLLLNILWIFLGGGIILFFEYLISGLALCITIIGIPFGLQCFKLAVFAIAPFGSNYVETENASGCLYILFNILWLILGGIGIVLTHLLLALIFAITIIGIPFAVQHVKMAGLAITPFGKRVI
ncbi:MAG: YccF domain-containing protein [Bacteroidales bacterium]|nr:YccF domain-containing protein [Bacteroidales bacterium]